MKKTNEFNSVKGGTFRRPIFNEVSDNDETGNDRSREKQSTEPVALSHTKTEQMLYEQMYAETRKVMTKTGAFSTRYLMVQTGIHNYSSVRRAQLGLLNKMSIERQKKHDTSKSSALIYLIYDPSEIIERRRKAGFNPYPKEIIDGDEENSTGRIIEKLVRKHNLSRRQAQVALECAEGLSNDEIGTKLFIQKETVKFHLRNIFIKFGVRRRAELIAYLFRHQLMGKGLYDD